MSARNRRLLHEETKGGFIFSNGETRRPKRNAETPQTDIWSYYVQEGISPAFDPNRALFRVLFLDENKTRYDCSFLPTNGLHADGEIWTIKYRTY
jgi:hypothetical protein